MACEPQNLVTAASCQFSCLSGKMLAAIRIRLLCAIIDGQPMACDAQTLVDAAKCIENCVPTGMMTAVEISLLCQVSSSMAVLNSSLAGLQQVFQGFIEPPVAPPTNPAKPAIYTALNTGSLYSWRVDTQTWI